MNELLFYFAGVVIIAVVLGISHLAGRFVIKSKPNNLEDHALILITGFCAVVCCVGCILLAILFPYGIGHAVLSKWFK